MKVEYVYVWVRVFSAMWRRIALLHGSDRQAAKEHSHEGELALAHLFQIG